MKGRPRIIIKDVNVLSHTHGDADIVKEEKMDNEDGTTTNMILGKHFDVGEMWKLY